MTTPVLHENEEEEEQVLIANNNGTNMDNMAVPTPRYSTGESIWVEEGGNFPPLHFPSKSLLCRRQICQTWSVGKRRLH